MNDPTEPLREALGRIDRDGTYQFDWNLTNPQKKGSVRLVIPPPNVLPVIFVPGIMGSNLRSTLNNKPVWRLDANVLINKPTSLLSRWATKSAGERQRVLHPARVAVDNRGAVPKKRVGSIIDIADYTERGWGEIAETSYHSFLLWIEEKLNGEGLNPYFWKEFSFEKIEPTHPPENYSPSTTLPPGIPMYMRTPPQGAEKGQHLPPILSDELIKRAGFRMPVYAFGYNWLDSNNTAAKELSERIQEIITNNNRHGSRCTQVILVTHSMGGLVARRCTMLDGMNDKIAGIVHGVMPTVGAAVAYRRCKVGMWDENKTAGFVIGNDGRKVTAVFAQAPGALQLLPSENYERDWLQIYNSSGPALETQPITDPYADIYLRRDRWWGLVREEWLNPLQGRPITWGDYRRNILSAKNFHEAINSYYHKCTYIYYGSDGNQESFEKIVWKAKRGSQPKEKISTKKEINEMGFEDVRDDGSNPVYVGGKLEIIPNYGMHTAPTIYQSSYWELHNEKQDSPGDGTVPVSSGRMPLKEGGENIRQQFRLSGFDHEGSYQNPDAQAVALYSIIKISGEAKELV